MSLIKKRSIGKSVKIALFKTKKKAEKDTKNNFF